MLENINIILNKLIGEHLIGEHLIGEHLIGEHLIGEHLIGEHLIGEHIVVVVEADDVLQNDLVSLVLVVLNYHIYD
jgi:hypothetical protein